MRQWLINWCTSLMMIHKITPTVDYSKILNISHCLKVQKPFYLFEWYQHVTVAFNLMLILTIYYYQNAQDTSTNWYHTMHMYFKT